MADVMKLMLTRKMTTGVPLQKSFVTRPMIADAVVQKDYYFGIEVPYWAVFDQHYCHCCTV